MAQLLPVEVSRPPQLEPARGMLIPIGAAGVVLSVTLAVWSATALPASQLQAGILALLSVAVMAWSVQSPGLLALLPITPLTIVPLRRGAALDLRLEVVLAVALMLVAAVPRLVDLTAIPQGFHGDEAVAGIEARRILEDGYIGPYSDEAAGVPAGSFYWTALVTAVTGESVFGVRLSFALIGIATVGAVYVATRLMLGREAAVIASLLLGVSAWHLHYSRIAFIPIGQPLFEVLAVACFALALGRRQRAWAAASGVFIGGSVYIYQGYPTFLLGLLLAWLALGVVCYRDRLAWFGGQVGIAVLVALVVAVPMVSYASGHQEQYFTRYRENSIFRTEEFRQADGLLEKALVLAGEERKFLVEVLQKPNVDGVDASGLVRLIDPVSMVLILLGIGIAIGRWRSPCYLGLLVMTAVLLLGPMYVIESDYRRALAATPMLAVFAALPIAYFVEQARRVRLQTAAVAASAGIILVVAGLNLQPYFTAYDDSVDAAVVYGLPATEVFKAIGRLDRDVYVYLYSSGVPFSHPGRLYLAPDSEGEDRTDWFEAGPVNYAADRSRDVFYALTDDHRADLPLIMAMYPDGRFVEGPRSGGRPVYVGYFVPRLQEADSGQPGRHPAE